MTPLKTRQRRMRVRRWKAGLCVRCGHEAPTPQRLTGAQCQAAMRLVTNRIRSVARQQREQDQRG